MPIRRLWVVNLVRLDKVYKFKKIDPIRELIYSALTLFGGSATIAGEIK